MLKLTQYIPNIGKLKLMMGCESASSYNDGWLIQVLMGVRNFLRSTQNVANGFVVTVLKDNVNE